jgi:hypothetical protein
MNTNELIAILERGLNNSDLHQEILAALSILREDKSASVSGLSEDSSANKNSILSTYRRRQKHLIQNGISLPGFDGTIASLSKCDSDQINLVIIKTGKTLASILLTPSRTVVGCYFGTDKRDE